MNLNLIYFFLLTVLFVTSCNSSKSIRLKDSSETKKDAITNSGIAQKIEKASIVHIDKKQRIVTIRSSRPLDKGFYITGPHHSEKENSIIKVYDTSYELLYIADILEGSPLINDAISLVSVERSNQLEQNYSEANID